MTQDPSRAADKYLKLGSMPLVERQKNILLPKSAADCNGILPKKDARG
jgi:hypothetical protein